MEWLKNCSNDNREIWNNGGGGLAYTNKFIYRSISYIPNCNRVLAMPLL